MDSYESPRSKVLTAIDEEIAYAKSLGLDRVEPSETPHTVGDYLTMLSTYLRKAQDAWTFKAGDRAARHEIRKIAAIAVRCLEEHGAPRRYEPPTTKPVNVTIPANSIWRHKTTGDRHQVASTMGGTVVTIANCSFYQYSPAAFHATFEPWPTVERYGWGV